MLPVASVKAPAFGLKEELDTGKLALKCWPPSVLTVPHTSTFVPDGSVRVSYQMTVMTPCGLTLMLGIACLLRDDLVLAPTTALKLGYWPPLSSLRTGI